MTDCNSIGDNINQCTSQTGCAFARRCTCDKGYGSIFSNGNQCRPCVGNQYKSSQGGGDCQNCNIPNTSGAKADGDSGNTYCKCNDATHGILNGQCVPCTGQGQQISKTTGQCECQEGFTKKNDTACVAKCDGPGMVPLPGNEEVCLCAAGYGTTEKIPSATIQCVSCTGETFKADAGVAPCSPCPPNQTGFTDQSGGNTECKCIEGYGLYWESCISCNGTGQQIDASTGNCVCMENFTQESGGSCRRNDATCNGVGQIADPSNRFSCVCLAGYGGNGVSMANITCTPCNGTMYKADIGANQCDQCPYGQTGVNDENGGNTKCTCLQNFGFYRGKCIACNGTGQTIDNDTKACICDNGFAQLSDGSCKQNDAVCDGPGQIGDVNNRLSCVCQQGYGGNGISDPNISCTPCQNNEFKDTISADSCKSCDQDQIAVPKSGNPSDRYTGPNTQCIPIGSCKQPACTIDNSCDSNSCGIYGQGCIFNSQEQKCSCDSAVNYVFDSTGRCVKQSNKAGTPVYGIIIGVVIALVVIIAVTLTVAIIIRKKKKNTLRQKSVTSPRLKMVSIV